MCDTGYSVKQLAADLEELGSRGELEAALLEEVQELVKRLLLMKHNWLRPSMSVPGRRLLREGPDHANAVFVVARAPGEASPTHEHGTWAVIAGLEGEEIHVTRNGEQKVDPRTILAIPAGESHSVRNDSGAVAVTLHVYGMNPDFTQPGRAAP